MLQLQNHWRFKNKQTEANVIEVLRLYVCYVGKIFQYTIKCRDVGAELKKRKIEKIRELNQPIFGFKYGLVSEVDGKK